MVGAGAAIGIAGWQAEGSGAIGMALGILAGTFSFWALWRIVLLLGTISEETASSRLGWVLPTLAMLMKVPVLVAGWTGANQAGGAAPTCFLLGIAMVYCALVGWAVASS